MEAVSVATGGYGALGPGPFYLGWDQSSNLCKTDKKFLRSMGHCQRHQYNKFVLQFLAFGYFLIINQIKLHQSS